MINIQIAFWKPLHKFGSGGGGGDDGRGRNLHLAGRVILSPGYLFYLEK